MIVPCSNYLHGMHVVQYDLTSQRLYGYSYSRRRHDTIELCCRLLAYHGFLPTWCGARRARQSGSSPSHHEIQRGGNDAVSLYTKWYSKRRVLEDAVIDAVIVIVTDRAGGTPRRGSEEQLPCMSPV